MHSDIWDYWPSSARFDARGFEVEALDGTIGTVVSASFTVGASYLVVDDDDSDEPVLLPAGLVERIDFDAAVVRLDRTRDEVLRAPRFRGDLLDPVYRAQLSGYYGLRAAQRERLAARGPGR